MTQIVRLLLSMVPQQRGYTIREPYVEYEFGDNDMLKNIPFAGENKT